MATTDNRPTFPAHFAPDNWTCPYCDNSAAHDWLLVGRSMAQPGGLGELMKSRVEPVTWFEVTSMTCRSCRQSSLYQRQFPYEPTVPPVPGEGIMYAVNATWTDESVEAVELHPANPRFGVGANSDMPQDVLDLYDEARAVALISPRSAAALLRVALETLLQGPTFGLTGKLHKMISDLKNRTDLQDFWQEVDVVRVVGNEAAHEATFRPTDGESVVHELQAIVNELVEVEITRPRLRTERINKIPPDKRRT